jgi:hypothetical protein
VVNLKKGDSLEDLGVGRKLILKWILQKEDWIHLAQNGDK